VALSDLGGWFGHKLRAATALAVYQGSAVPAWLDAARSETVVADAAYTTLAADTAYIATFSEQMRMARLRLPDFHWSEQLPRLGADMESIDLIATEVTATPSTRLASAALPDPAKWLATGRERGPGLVALDVAPQDPTAPLWTVAITLASSPPPGAAVRLLYRPFRSDGADWAAVDATGSGASWSATVPGTGAGGMFAVEVVGGPGTGWRYPDMTVETPYRAVAP